MKYPPGIEPTPPEEREKTSKFDVKTRKTKRDIRDEMEKMGVDEWRIETETGSSASPAVIVRWSKDGKDYAVVSDGYTTKKSNYREAYLWINETRMREKRKVSTAEDEFASARLPSGDADIVAQKKPPYEILGVEPGASAEEVRAAFREKVSDAHPDTGGGSEQFKRLKTAKELMLNE